jgi:hypothetical protein
LIVRNKSTNNLHNIKEVNIKFHGTFSDIINYNTACFLHDNTDPKVFFLDIIDRNGKYITKQFDITTRENVHGKLADLRFRFMGENGWTITRLRIYYKPKKLIQDEQNFMTYGLIQDPVMYTIIFNNDVTKPNE